MANFSHLEPVHPDFFLKYNYLIKIYKHIKENYQIQIDQAFDAISRKIGFIVTTSIPLEMKAGKDKKIMNIDFGVENLKNTLFEDIKMTLLAKDKNFIAEINKVLNNQDQVPELITINIIWYEALKLKLKWHWCEPAHFMHGIKNPVEHPESAKRIFPNELLPDPAQWIRNPFDIDLLDKINITAIDEVYADLNLVERIITCRMNRQGILREGNP